jgi:hypothetical protein
MCICADGDVRREVERKAVDLLYDITSEGVEKMSYTREQVDFSQKMNKKAQNFL